MEKTIVNRWDQVCYNNWDRAHIHLSYSLGYILGCFLGGFVSDRLYLSDFSTQIVKNTASSNGLNLLTLLL